jgi:hypothetical protein
MGDEKTLALSPPTHDVIFGSWKFYPDFSWHATAWKAEKQIHFK